MVFTLLCGAFSHPTPAVDLPNYQQNDVQIFQKIYQELSTTGKQFDQLANDEKFKYLIPDPANLIDDQFQITPYFQDAVSFWFKIYSYYDSSFAVIHDREYLNLVYASLNFAELKDTTLRDFIQQGLQEQLASEKLLEIKRALTSLGKKPAKLSELQQNIVQTIKAYPLKIPTTAKAIRDFYQNLAANARPQTGLHDHLRLALTRYFPYQTAIRKFFATFEMPPELLAISFVESSFNPNAQSFVGALGIWQFMPNVAQHFLPMSKDIDGRKNPLLATLGALHLLKENYQIFKRWDLAISAYNSGTKHLLLGKKKIKNLNNRLRAKYGAKAKLLDDDLATILQHYDHPHLGFASKNYYSEFLAMQWSLTYRDQLFVNLPRKEKDYGEVEVYLTCASLSWPSLSERFPHLPALNTHLASSIKNLGAGTIILSNQPLPAEEFILVDPDTQRRVRPIKWMAALKKQGKWCPAAATTKVVR